MKLDNPHTLETSIQVNYTVHCVAELSLIGLYLDSPGTVCGVDENSAYSWEVCDRCQQENLAQDTSSQ